MRIVLIAIGTIAVVLVAVATLVDWHVELPPIAPSVEQVCVDSMKWSSPDLSWSVEGREEKIQGREIKTVTLGELPLHDGRLVRVAGVLHAEFEWVALYLSRAAMEDRSSRAPWVALGSLWPFEPYWRTKGPSISDRCVIVEGTYFRGPSGHYQMFDGLIRDLLRLEVWSVPHRPFITTVPPPPPPPPPTTSAR